MPLIPQSSPEQEADAKDFRDAAWADGVGADYWPASDDNLVPFVQIWTPANPRIPTEVVWFTTKHTSEWGTPNRDLVYPHTSSNKGAALWAEVEATIEGTA